MTIGVICAYFLFECIDFCCLWIRRNLCLGFSNVCVHKISTVFKVSNNLHILINIYISQPNRWIMPLLRNFFPWEGNSYIRKFLNHTNSFHSTYFTSNIESTFHWNKQAKMRPDTCIAGGKIPELSSALGCLTTGSRKKSHEDKIPCKKKSHEDKIPCKKKSHEDKIPCKKKYHEDKIPCRKKSHEDKIPCKKKSHEDKIPCRKKSHEDKIPCRKKSHEDKIPCKKKSHEDKIPCKKKSHEDKIPCRKKSHEGKIPCRKKSHEDNIPCRKISQEGISYFVHWNMFQLSVFQKMKTF